MAKFRTRFVLYTLILILFTSISYLFFLFQTSSDVLKPQSLAKLRTLMLISGIAITISAIVGLIIVSFFLTRGITKPISALVKATQGITKRNFDQRIKVRGYAEIQQLVSSFNHMVRELKIFKQETKKRHHDLEEIARERTKELSCIYKIGRDVSSTLELNEVLDTVTRSTIEVLDLKICTILLVEEIMGNRLKIARTKGINSRKLMKQSIEIDEGISGWVWRNKEAILLKDIDQDSRFIHRKKERYYTGNLMSVPLELKGKIIGVINANNKLSGKSFRQSDLLLLKEIAAESAIAIENALLYKSLKEVYVHTISALASALDAKDHYTRSHSENVTRYALAIAEEIGLVPAQIEIIRQACQLHDLGKIGIHDYILSKTGKLTAEEWKEIRMHAIRGAQILQPIGFLREVADLIRQHHERFDGKGYPYNLNGQQIQLGARIMTIADAFDAMTSERPYRGALTLSQAIAELKVHSGKQFDPGIVKIFLHVLENKPSLLKGLKQKQKS